MDEKGEEAFDGTLLGHAEEVAQERIGDNECILIKGMKASPSASLILRGANDVLLEEMELSVHDVFCGLRRTLETKFSCRRWWSFRMCSLNLFGEICHNSYIKGADGNSRICSEKTRYSNNSCRNAAKNSINLVGTLRSFHNAAQNGSLLLDILDPSSLKWYGLDLLGGELRDNLKTGVLEPMVVKVKALKSSTEACISILSLDDFFRLVHNL